MARLLTALPLVALLGGVADALWVRRSLAHREPSVALVLQSVVLWLAFAALALAPAWATLRLVPRLRRAGAVAAGAVLAFWTVAPVVAHAVLDTHTDLGGDLSGLVAPGPWLQVLAAVAALAAVVALVGLVLERLGAARAAFATLAVALVGGGVASTLGAGAPSGPRAAAPAQGRPNLLVLVWDTTRSKSLLPYGYERETTTWLERFAERAVVFEEARSPSRFTLTSHLSMLTGVYPSHHGARMTRQSFDAERTPTVATLLRRAGYRTGGFVGTAVLAARTGIARDFETWDDEVDPPVCDTAAWSLVHDVQSVAAALCAPLRGNGLPHWFQDFQRPAADVLASARRWIERGDDGRPWFCFVNMYDVHWPYLPDADARERWVRPYDGPIDGYLFRSDAFQPGYELDGDDDRHLSDLYDGEMWRLDREVERFLAALDLDGTNTVVVVTSDHGEAFGEAGVYGHDDVKEVQLRIPLVVRLPNGADARRVPEPVSGVDLAPTLLALADVAAPAHVTGRDLLAQEHDPGRILLVEDRDHMDRGDVRLVIYRDRWKLVRYGVEAHDFELFDLESDPDGLQDVAPRHADVVDELNELLDGVRAAWGADDEGGGSGNVDLESLRALGYVEE